MTVRTTIRALCILSLSGCTLFSPVHMDTKTYALSTIPDDFPMQRTHAATLLVLVPESAPAYATPRMAYSSQQYQIAYFSQNEWVATPAQMLQPLIVETLQRTHYFSEVLSSPFFGRPTFSLRTEIIELTQDFSSDPAVLRLTMRCYLTRETSHQVVATKELSTQELLSERNPYAGVVAANTAAARLLRELSRFVVEHAH